MVFALPYFLSYKLSVDKFPRNFPLELPTPNPPQHNTSPDSYCFVVFVAEISIFLVISTIFAFACCSPHRFVQNFRSLFHPGAIASGQSQKLISVSKYKKIKPATQNVRFV